MNITHSLSLLLALIAFAVGVLHILWAVRVTFPFEDEETLARAVIGRRGIARMPGPESCLMTAAIFFATAALAIALGYSHDNAYTKWPLAFTGLFAGMVFLLRGLIGVLPAFEQALPERPFLVLNRKLYSPLSAAIGLGFITLVLSLPNWTWRLKQIFSGWA
jgi:nitrogen fixation-related uncharacterized protein